MNIVLNPDLNPDLKLIPPYRSFEDVDIQRFGDRLGYADYTRVVYEVPAP